MAPPPPPYGPEIFFRDERDETLAEIGQFLQKVSSSLAKSGKVTLQSGMGEKHIVQPPDQCTFIVAYERMPRGELSLKLELKWMGGSGPAPMKAGPVVVVDEP